MQPTKSREAGLADIQNDATDAQAKECESVKGDASPQTPDAVAAAIWFMEEYAEVFEELAK